MTLRRSDCTGRLRLGSAFAHLLFSIDTSDPQRIVLTPVGTMSTKKLLSAQKQELLRLGLGQSRARRFSPTPPDLDADKEIAAGEE
jgi:hypothetical protein